MSHIENQIPFLYRQVLLDSHQCMDIQKEFFENTHNHEHVEVSSKNSTDLECLFSQKNSRILLSKSINCIWDTLEIAIQEYKELYPVVSQLSLDWGLYDKFNIQFYNPGQGFGKYHCENLPYLSRFLVWTIYLSNTPDGGTEFLHFDNHIEKCEMGKVIIFPADWTFMHRSQISTSRCKMIATGWINYREPEKFII